MTIGNFAKIIMILPVMVLCTAILSIDSCSVYASTLVGPNIQGKKRITAVIPPDFPPTYFMDKSTGKAAGFAVDVMNEVAARAGLDVEYVFEDGWTNIMSKVLTGQADMIPAIGISAEREKYLLFTRPIEAYPVSFFVRSEDPATGKIPDDYRLGVIKGSVAHSELNNRGVKNLLGYDSFERAIFDLLAGRLDAFAGPAHTIIKLARDSGVEDKIKTTGTPIAEVKRAIAVKKDNILLLGILNQALDGFVGQQEYQRIYVKWYGTPAPYWTSKRIITVSIGLILIITAGMAGWRYYSLFRLNRELLNNIRERKNAENIGRDSEARYRDLFENVSDLIQSVSPEGKFLYVNKAWRNALGYAEEELEHLSVFDIINPDCRDHCVDAMRRVLKGENLAGVEAIFVGKNGRQIIVDGTVNCKFEDGKPVATRGIFRDITERKKISDQLIKVNRRNELILTCTGEGILGIDLNGNHTFINPAAARMLGHSIDELMGQHSHSVWHHTREDGTPYPEEECPVYSSAKTGAINDNVQNEVFWRKDGSFFPVIYSTTPILDNGRIVGSVLSFRDITENKRAETEIQDREIRLRTILETVQAGIVLIDAETHTIVDINSAAARLIGLTKENIIGSTCHSFICTADKGKCPITDFGQIVDNSERILLTSHGVRIPVIKTVVPLNLNGRRHLIESFLDITEQRTLEKQLLQSQKMDAIGQLAGGIAHDFNNILSTIIGSAHICLNKLGYNELPRRNVEQILESSQRATELTRNLLAFARKQTVDLRVIDVGEVISGFENILKRLIREDIELRSILATDTLKVMADRGQIEQVIMNLVTNARDAIPARGTITIETKRVTIDEGFVRHHGYGVMDDYACISVSDNGSGMKDETKKKIFEPFFTTKEPGKGTGLGLATVYGIVKKHDGYINVISAAGKGTTFNIYLPITKEALKSTERREECMPASRKGHQTILVAEDDHALRKLTTAILSDSGYKVVAVGNGEEAVNAFNNKGADIELIILDGIMPRKNGKEAYEQIKRLRPDIKAIFMSGYAEDIFTADGILTSEVAFIAKPASPSELLKKVRTVLDAKLTN